MLRTLRRAVVSALLAVICPAVTNAQCLNLSVLDAKPSSTAIFSGVATNTRPLFYGEIVTFTVDAVWLGAVDTQVLAYRRRGSHGVEISIGTKYLIFAHPPNESSLLWFPKDFYLSPTELAGLESVRAELKNLDFDIHPCASRPFEIAQRDGWIRDLGPSHPPRK